VVVVEEEEEEEEEECNKEGRRGEGPWEGGGIILSFLGVVSSSPAPR